LDALVLFFVVVEEAENNHACQIDESRYRTEQELDPEQHFGGYRYALFESDELEIHAREEHTDAARRLAEESVNSEVGSFAALVARVFVIIHQVGYERPQHDVGPQTEPAECQYRKYPKRLSLDQEESRQQADGQHGLSQQICHLFRRSLRELHPEDRRAHCEEHVGGDECGDQSLHF